MNRLRYLMNNFFRLLASTLYVTNNSLYKVKVNSTCNRNSKVQQSSQLLAQSIDTLYNHNIGCRGFYSPVSRVHFNKKLKACIISSFGSIETNFELNYSETSDLQEQTEIGGEY